MLRLATLGLALLVALPALAEAGYVYSPVGKRDPFHAWTRPADRPPPPAWCGELCAYELGQLKLRYLTGTPPPVEEPALPPGRCPVCGQDNALHFKWCMGCGAELPK